MFSILSALSLLLFVAVVVLWVRTLLVVDCVGWWWTPPDRSRQTESCILSGMGRVAYGRYESAGQGPYPDRRDDGWRTYDVNWPRGWAWGAPPWQACGFAVGVKHSKDGNGERHITTAFAVPYWSLACLTLVLPTTWALRRKRAGPGLCPSCGYDLCATPDRCPECGEPAAPAGVG